MSSLRTRLFLALAAVVTLAGAVSGLAIYWWMYGEAIELQDGLIVQVGSFLAERPGPPDLTPSQDVDSDARLSVAELGQARSVDPSPLASVSNEIADGLHTLDLQGKTWRVLVQTRRDASRIVVGQPIEARDEVARGSAIHAVASFAALIPCLMVLIGLVIRYSFRPVSGLTETLDRDRDGVPSRLPDKDLPDELRPFILAINRLIGRIADQLDRERRFIADAAHGLRTPIAALTVQAQNLENAPNEADRIRRANELRTGLRRTARLLDQLLDHARYAALANSSETVDISTIAKSTVAELLPLAEEKAVDLGFARADKAPVRIAPAAFATIVQNLVGNALAYVHEGGRVDVAIAVADGRATFLIEDDGPGIPSDEIQTIVEPFKRGTSTIGHGAGLGLSIVDRIVHTAGGRLDLGIPPNGKQCGLRVTVSLPLANP